MKLLLLTLPVIAVLAGCKSGVYELEKPDRTEMNVSIWQGSDELNDVIKLENGELMEVQFVMHKERPRDWFADKTGRSGFHIEDLEGNELVSFKCTKEQAPQYAPNTIKCVRFEVDSSTVAA